MLSLHADAMLGRVTCYQPSGQALIYATTGTQTFRKPIPPDTAAGAAAPAGRGERALGGGGRGGRGGRGSGAASAFAVLNLSTRATRIINGTGATMSADGSTLAWINRSADAYTLSRSPTLGDAVTVVRTGRERLDAPALSPDGSLMAYQMMQFTDWQLYVAQGEDHTRVTRDIQHDVLPRFLTNTTLLGMMGESRHRRSQVYDLTTGVRRRLFHNNTIQF